jgi:hypothetical protein
MAANILIDEIENYRAARRLIQKRKMAVFNQRQLYLREIEAFQKLRRVEFYLNSEIIRLKAKKNFRCEC